LCMGIERKGVTVMYAGNVIESLALPRMRAHSDGMHESNIMMYLDSRATYETIIFWYDKEIREVINDPLNGEVYLLP
jgi:hypothetical protein